MPSWQEWRSSSSTYGQPWTLVSYGWTPTSPNAPPPAATRQSRELDDWLINARELTVRRKFGDNEDGNAAADRFVRAGHEYIASMKNAQQVFRNMAATFRAAGRTATEADEAGQQMFRGKPE